MKSDLILSTESLMPTSSAASLREHDPAPANDRELRLADIPMDEEVELVRIDLPEDEVEPLLERGVLPGCRLCPVRRSPFGDPVVMVDGTLIAFRREMAGCLCVRQMAGASD